MGRRSPCWSMARPRDGGLQPRARRTSRRCSPASRTRPGPNGAVGFRVIDTTTLTNGLHTISWAVIDNQGASEGIGSRFFTVSNGRRGAVTARRGVDGRRGKRRGSARDRHRRFRDDGAAARAARVGPRGALAGSRPGARAGRDPQRRGEPRRTVARDPGHATRATCDERGLAPLPIGSQLDAATGVFTWAPGVGFVGAYDLCSSAVGDDAVARREVRVILAPKGSGRRPAGRD